MSPNRESPPRRHQFFILALWTQPASRPGEAQSWRFSLEDAQTAERKGFADLVDLQAFLAAWMEERVSSDQ